MNEQLIAKILSDMLEAADETQKLLDSFPPDYVKEKTLTSPSRLMAEVIYRGFLEKEKYND